MKEGLKWEAMEADTEMKEGGEEHGGGDGEPGDWEAGGAVTGSDRSMENAEARDGRW